MGLPQRDGVFLRRAVDGERDKLEEVVVVEHEHHGRVIGVGLYAEESFRGVVCLAVVQTMREEPFEDGFVRCESHAAVHEELHRRPYLAEVLFPRVFDH